MGVAESRHIALCHNLVDLMKLVLQSRGHLLHSQIGSVDWGVGHQRRMVDCCVFHPVACDNLRY